MAGSIDTDDFHAQGFCILAPLIPSTLCDRLCERLGLLDARRPGSRRLLGLEPVAHAAAAIGSHPSVRPLLAERAKAVQCTLFIKDVTTNWSVTPHQDLSIPVRKRLDVPGWSGWSVKEGVLFVQPPVAVLEQLVAVRLQLDHDSEATGPLEVVAGTHRLGRLPSGDVSRWASQGTVRCVVPRGGALAMRPLIVHTSGKSTGGVRRVLHFLFGPPLPAGLCWAD